jgi:hypothetical protein
MLLTVQYYMINVCLTVSISLSQCPTFSISSPWMSDTMALWCAQLFVEMTISESLPRCPLWDTVVWTCPSCLGPVALVAIHSLHLPGGHSQCALCYFELLVESSEELLVWSDHRCYQSCAWFVVKFYFCGLGGSQIFLWVDHWGLDTA